MFLFELPGNEKKRLLVFGYPKRNDFSALSFNFGNGNGNGNGNEMSFPLSLTKRKFLVGNKNMGLCIYIEKKCYLNNNSQKKTFYLFVSCLRLDQ